MNESNELIARIESLEKKNRRLVRIGSAALIVFAGLGAMSLRSTCDTVSAERFVLLDTQGRQRALLTAYDTAPQLSLYDKKGRASATLGIGKTGAFLSLADADAEKTVRYGVDVATSETPTAEPKKTGPVMPADEAR